jgi:hypothetical protein
MENSVQNFLTGHSIEWNASPDLVKYIHESPLSTLKITRDGYIMVARYRQSSGTWQVVVGYTSIHTMV